MPQPCNVAVASTKPSAYSKPDAEPGISAPCAWPWKMANSPAIATAAAYLVMTTAVCLALPAVNEVPEQFPATVLWQFRIASLGAQLLLWVTLGLGFGWAAERVPLGRSEPATPLTGSPRSISPERG